MKQEAQLRKQEKEQLQSKTIFFGSTSLIKLCLAGQV